MADIKKGLSMPLLVRFRDLDFDEVEKIDFIFKNSPADCCRTEKRSVYKKDGTGDAYLSEQAEKTVVVPFSPADTRKFNSSFMMDVKITIEGDEFNPMTGVIGLTMSPTLFGEEDDGDD